MMLGIGTIRTTWLVAIGLTPFTHGGAGQLAHGPPGFDNARMLDLCELDRSRATVPADKDEIRGEADDSMTAPHGGAPESII
jgi:hypothetical protein